jgi:VanZ family protein
MGRRTAERTVPALLLGFWLPAALYAALVLAIGSIPYLKQPLPMAFGDKVMHVIEYFVLGLLVTRAARATWNPALPAALVALCIGILVGTADELNQAHVPGRSSSTLDLFADTVGVGLAPLVMRALARP